MLGDKAFIKFLQCPLLSVKGQTVTPQARPPHGWQPIADSRKDDASYKGKKYDCKNDQVHLPKSQFRALTKI